jgi:DNA-binding LacI/PurR family transcriptional regulator
MSEIARAAGVGKATVSLALRNDPRLRIETRRQIQAIAKKMGYKSNAVVSNLMAQLRASKDPKYQATLGLVNASQDRNFLQTNPTFSAVNSGLKHRAAELGYGLDEFWLREPGIDPTRLGQILRARNIHGVIVAAMIENISLAREFDSVWQDLACVTVGIRPEHPAFHFACNDQFSTAYRCAKQLARLGYKRPGLVIDPHIEKVIDHRFSAGFYAGENFAGPKERVPVFEFAKDRLKVFSTWMTKHSPDVLVTTHAELRDWIVKLGLKCPKQIGLAHLDINKGMEDWSGMNQKNELVGSSAIDLVVGQLHRNETGTPEFPKCVMVESQWVRGKTLRY